MTNKKVMIKNLLICVILSVLFNFFFLFNHWNLSVLIFNIILLILLYIYLRKEENFNLRIFILYAFSIIILSIPFFRFEFRFFSTINCLLIPFIYGLLINNSFDLDLISLLEYSFNGLFNPLTKLNTFFADIGKVADKKNRPIKKVLIGLLLSGLVLIIIIPLLLSSDAIFKATFSGLFDFFVPAEGFKMLFRILVFLFIAAYLYSQFNYKTKFKIKEERYSCAFKFDNIISVVFLATINIIYITFCYIQLKYLFIRYGSLPNNITYADYAREGFFQLVFVTAFNILIVILFNKFKKSNRLTNLLISLTVICTYIMTFSAFYRMNLYESAYGYTRLRLLVYLFLIAEAIVLIPIIVGIFKTHFKFLEYAVISLFIYYLMISFINMDAFIAKQNINRYLETTQLDKYHLESLSVDALPEIEKLTTDSELGSYFKETILIKYNNSYYSASWYEYNLSNVTTKDLFNRYYPNGYNAKEVPHH